MPLIRGRCPEPNTASESAYHAQRPAGSLPAAGGHVRVSFRSAIRVVATAAAGVLLVAASPGWRQAASATLDVEGMDPAAAACTDFYQYADGKLARGEPDSARTGPAGAPFDELRQRNQNDLREILEKLAADKSSAPGSDERKLGDFYGACMDEAGIETAGVAPDQAGARAHRRDQGPSRPAGGDRTASDDGRQRPLRFRIGRGPQGLLARDRGGDPGRARTSRPRLLPEVGREVRRASQEVRGARRRRC